MANRLIQNILDSLKLTDEDDDDFYDEEEEETLRRPTRKDAFHASVRKREMPPKRIDSIQGSSRPMRTAAPVSRIPASYDDDDFEPRRERTSRMERAQQQANSRIVPLRPTTSSSGFEVCIMKPTRFDDAKDLCDILKSERAIIVNLDGMELSLAQRIIDFTSGAIYSLNAKIHQISDFIYCISPEKIDISGDYIEMLGQTGGFEVPRLERMK